MQNSLIRKVIPLLIGFTEEYAVSISNKGIVKRSLKEMSDKEFKVEWDEEKIVVSSEDFKVELNEIPNNFKCSCPSRSICKHVIIGYLYLSKKRVELFGEEEGSRNNVPTPLIKEKKVKEVKEKVKEKNTYKDVIKVIEFVKRILLEIYSSGLARCPSSIIRDLEQAAILCKGIGLVKQEKDIRILSDELQKYIDKSSLFNLNNYFNTITRLTLNLKEISSIKKEDFEKNFIKGKGEYKREFNGEVIALGGEYFNTKSGFEGASIYLYSKELDEIFTLTNARATIYEGNLNTGRGLWDLGAPWSVGGTFKSLLSQRIEIKNGLISEENRFSSSKDTLGAQKGKVKGRELIELLDFTEDFKDLKISFEKVSYNFIKIEEYKGINHNKIEGFFEIKVVDKGNKIHKLKLKYEDWNGRIIEKLQRTYENVGISKYLFCKTFVEEGEKIIVPISFFDEGTTFNIWI